MIPMFEKDFLDNFHEAGLEVAKMVYWVYCIHENVQIGHQVKQGMVVHKIRN